MSSKDENAFERKMLNDAFEADAMEGFEQYPEQDTLTDLQALKKQLNKHTNKKYLFFNRSTISIAATLLFVAGIVSVLLLYTPNQKTLVSDNIKPTVNTKKSITDTKKDIEKGVASNKSEHPGISHNELNEESIAEKKFEDELTLVDKDELEIAPVPAKRKKAKLKTDKVDSKITLSSKRKIANSTDRNDELIGTMKGEKVYGIHTAKNESLSTIQGKVRNEYAEPIAGAQINIKGTNYSAISKADGSYKLNYLTQDSSKPVTASFAGYVSSEKSSSMADSVIFDLEEENYSLSEVITIKTDEDQLNKVEGYVAAEPIVGMDNYIEELTNDLIYPPKGTGKKETVVVSVVISPLGYIKDILIKRSPGELYSMEAIRVIQESTGWKPATNMGLPIQDEVKIRLRFIPTDK